MLCPGAYCWRPWRQGQALWGTQPPPARYSPGAHSQPLAQSSRQCPSSAAPAVTQLAGQEDTQSEYRCPWPHCHSAGHRGADRPHPNTSQHIPTHPSTSQYIPLHPSHHVPLCPTTSHHVPLHPSHQAPHRPTQPSYPAVGSAPRQQHRSPPAPQAAEGRRKGSGNGIHSAKCSSLWRGAALGKGAMGDRGKREPPGRIHTSPGCMHTPSGCPRAPWVLAAHSRVRGEKGAGDPSIPRHIPTAEARSAPVDVGLPLGAVPHVARKGVADGGGWRGPHTPLPAVHIQAGLVEAVGLDLVQEAASGWWGRAPPAPRSRCHSPRRGTG